MKVNMSWLLNTGYPILDTGHRFVGFRSAPPNLPSGFRPLVTGCPLAPPAFYLLPTAYALLVARPPTSGHSTLRDCKYGYS